MLEAYAWVRTLAMEMARQLLDAGVKNWLGAMH